MYAYRHTKKRGTLIVACPALEAFELARITEQTTKTPRRMRKKHTTPFFTNECNMNIIIPIDIYRCMVLVILEVFEVSRAKNQASINALPICLSHPTESARKKIRRGRTLQI